MKNFKPWPSMSVSCLFSASKQSRLGNVFDEVLQGCHGRMWQVAAACYLLLFSLKLRRTQQETFQNSVCLTACNLKCSLVLKGSVVSQACKSQVQLMSPKCRSSPWALVCFCNPSAFESTTGSDEAPAILVPLWPNSSHYHHSTLST